MTRRKVGLALGGGGARGLAHVGVLEVLAGAGVAVDAIAGTSMGGMVGALFAAGATVEELRTWALGLNRAHTILDLSDLTLHPRGFLKGTALRARLADRLGHDLRFADLPIPVAVTAVDTRSGRSVVLQEGSVVDAVRATVSVPGMLVPVERDGMTLVDGGLLNNVPVDVVRELGAEVVVAVNVVPDFSRNRPGEPPVVRGLRVPGLPMPLMEHWNLQMMMVSALTEQRFRACPPDVVIAPEMPEEIGVLVGFHRAEEILAAGRKAAEAALPQLEALLGLGAAGPFTGG